MLIFKW
jgi:hypothetical protein